MVRRNRKYLWRDRERHFYILNTRKSIREEWEQGILFKKSWLVKKRKTEGIYNYIKWDNSVIADRGCAPSVSVRAMNGDSGTTNPDNLSKPKGDRDAKGL